MSPRLVAIPWSAAALLAVCSGFLYREWRRSNAELAEAVRRHTAELEGRQRSYEEQLRKLSGELEQSRKRERELAMEARRNSEKKVEVAPTVAPREEEPPAPAEREREATMLTSVDEATLLSRELLAKGDIEGLWLLAADLLSMGEEGHDKLLELLRLLEDDEWKKSFEGVFESLWNRPEIFVGPFLRAVSEHDEELLKFGLHVMSKDEKELPKMINQMRRDFDDEIAPVLLGFYDGSDSELLGGYVERYRTALAGDIGEARDAREMIWALGHIPTEESTDLLIDLLTRAPRDAQAHVIRSLTWQRSERALPALRSLLPTTTDARLAATIRAAIRHLE